MIKLDQDFLVKNNYYFHNVTRPEAQSATGEYKTDVCVIGAGFAGLSAALELAKLGFKVTVLEARTIGFGASGRNGGKALTGYSCSNAIFEKYCGMEAAKAAWDISLEGIKLIKQRCEEYKIDCEWRDGNLIVGTCRSKVQKLKQDYEETLNKYNWPNTRWIPEQDIRSEVDSPAYYGGFYDPNGGHFHPVKYLFGIAKAARALGVEIYENSKVTSIDKGEINSITTKDAVIKAKYVVVAANVYLQDLLPDISKHIMPAGTWMVASVPLSDEIVNKLIPSHASVYDTNNALDYFRFTQDNRLIFGGGVSYSTLFPKDLKKSLRKNISKVFPQLDGINLEFAWGGHVDLTLHRYPDFGRIGKLVAQTIATQIDRLDVFAKLPHETFPGFGDYSRTLLLMMGMLYYRLLDMIG
jgi:gamma-glutamylputrescine oxidase